MAGCRRSLGHWGRHCWQLALAHGCHRGRSNAIGSIATGRCDRGRHFALRLFVWLAITRPFGEPIDANRRQIERRIQRRLDEIVHEVRQAGPRSPGGARYEAFDGTMFLLLLHTWSMINEPSQWTYDPANHRDLIGNYVVARLDKTAEIAISKHPHQCKYGAVAHNLSDYAGRWLRIVQLITQFDPLPQFCPECAEPKPSHQANCMAAICWRCKYPTPPRYSNSQKTTVITPQCHIPILCYPRGEMMAPMEPIANRIRLPFTIPHNAEDECLTMETGRIESEISADCWTYLTTTNRRSVWWNQIAHVPSWGRASRLLCISRPWYPPLIGPYRQ